MMMCYKRFTAGGLLTIKVSKQLQEEEVRDIIKLGGKAAGFFAPTKGGTF